MNTKKLKELVLDLAIHGKLVPQDPNDEPASVLLERIQAEKAKMAKGKKSTASEPIGDVPFEVPEGWCWTTILTIADDDLGKTLDTAKNKGIYKLYLRSANVLWGNFDFSDLKEMKFEDSEIEFYSLKKGDLLVCEGGDIGRAAIWNSDQEVYFQNALHRLRFREGIISNLFLYILYFYKVTNVLDDFSQGVTIKHLTKGSLSKIPFPLPPLAEQQRIVAEIERWFKVIDALEGNEGDLLKSIEQTKKKVLDLAIHGKLVPQDPNDEPASVLLERIQAEKAKTAKGKKSATSEPIEDVPFEVPEGWEWTNIGVLLTNRDAERKPVSSAVRKKLSNRIYDYYGATGVVDKIDSYLFDERLLLIGEDGANLLSRSKDNAFFADGKYWVNNHAHILDCKIKSVLDYVAIVINSLSLDDYITGSAQPKLSQDNLNKILIPLPPLAEQQRIVAKIDEIFGELDKIKEMVG